MTGEVAASTATSSPSALFGELFSQVAQLGLMSSKDWADATPREAPQAILAAYRAAAPATREDVAEFVRTWFVLPTDVKVMCRCPTLEAQIDATWAALVRQSSAARLGESFIPLPQVSVSPGGRFRECYYWDSYFSLLGLQDRPDIIRATAANMRWQVQQYGFVPNANRTYYLTRSQPPLFFKVVELLALIDGEQAVAEYLPALVKEHAFWMRGASELSAGASERVVRFGDGAELNRYWDEADTPRDESYQIDLDLALQTPGISEGRFYRDIRAACESGWDFSSRWFGERGGLGSISTTSIVPVDLNSFLYGQESYISDALGRSGQTEEARRYRSFAERRLQCIRHRLWNDAAGMFDDLNWETNTFCGSVSAAMLAPLWMAAATEEQARLVATQVERSLLAPGGLMTTTAYSREQWDAPNGWAPLQWMATEGLSRYGYHDLADEIRSRWVSMVRAVFESSGRLCEKYDVVTRSPGGGGEYTLQDGFGWTNGVTSAFLKQMQAQAIAACAE